MVISFTYGYSTEEFMHLRNCELTAQSSGWIMHCLPCTYCIVYVLYTYIYNLTMSVLPTYLMVPRLQRAQCQSHDNPL